MIFRCIADSAFSTEIGRRMYSLQPGGHFEVPDRYAYAVTLTGLPVEEVPFAPRDAAVQKGVPMLVLRGRWVLAAPDDDEPSRLMAPSAPVPPPRLVMTAKKR